MQKTFLPVDISLVCKEPGEYHLEGEYGYLEPLSIAKHWHLLYLCLCENAAPDLWQYLPAGPFDQTDEFLSWLKDLPNNNSVYIIFDKTTNDILGLICYLNGDLCHRTLEIGWVIFSEKMQRTRIGTEVIYLLLKYAFALNYRRLEWKCDLLNKKSSQAALRFGFQYEGVFRNHRIVKGRNRDTAWFSITDTAWPDLKNKFEQWLDPSNFDGNGKQLCPLSKIFLNSATTPLDPGRLCCIK